MSWQTQRCRGVWEKVKVPHICIAFPFIWTGSLISTGTIPQPRTSPVVTISTQVLAIHGSGFYFLCFNWTQWGLPTRGQIHPCLESPSGGVGDSNGGLGHGLIYVSFSPLLTDRPLKTHSSQGRWKQCKLMLDCCIPSLRTKLSSFCHKTAGNRHQTHCENCSISIEFIFIITVA